MLMVLKTTSHTEASSCASAGLCRLDCTVAGRGLRYEVFNKMMAGMGNIFDSTIEGSFGFVADDRACLCNANSAALNFAELRPHEGAEALLDRTDVPLFGTPSRASR